MSEVERAHVGVLFSAYLPWAIVFGLADRWQKVCAELAAEGRIPDTPLSYSGPAFYRTFGSDSASFGQSLVSVISASADTGGSSGGGSSGGGGGGGGGRHVGRPLGAHHGTRLIELPDAPRPGFDPPALVCQVGTTTLRYHLSAVEDLHAWPVSRGDWVDLGASDEKREPPPGTVEA